MAQTDIYRVIKITTNDFAAYNRGLPSKVDETVEWSGSDIDELSRMYPPSKIWGADSFGHKELEDGLIRFDYRFEQFEGGQWQEVDDPRRRLTPMSTFEYEVDAENRRDFPGEYYDTCGGCLQLEPCCRCCSYCGVSPCECEEMARV